MAVYEVDSLSITQGENTYNIHTNPGATLNVEYDSNNKKLTKTINGTTSDVVTVATLKSDMNLAKGDVGLGNVENKSSSTIRSEITSSNVTTALGYTPVNESTKGVAGGVAELDENGRVPSSQLPSYVDDVVEYSDISKFPISGEKGKIYVDISTNKTYRWGGETYVEISESLALGNTSSTAFRGDYGNTAYNHAINKGSAFNSGLYKITTNSEGHVTNATAVAKSDITGLGIPAQDTTYSNATTSVAGLMSADDKTKLNGIASGATANVGTITGITMNGASKGTSGVVDLGAVITSHQDISGKVSGPASATNNAVAIFDGTGGKTIKNSGFTIGKSVPSDAKFTDTTYSNATTSAAGLMSADDKTKLDGIATGATANVGTITGIKMNGASKGTSGVVDLGTVITSHQDISGKVSGPASATNNAVAIFDGTGGKTIKNSGFTIGKSVPSDAKFTDTTYSNATTSAAGLMSADDKTKLDGIATGATANVGTITGITMNGASKGTSGVVDLGTVITSHQDISGKADKSSTVSNVSYDSTNNKITKTINGTTSDVVTAATLKTAMSLGNVENKSSATIRSEITSSNVTTALGFTPMNASLKGANNGVAELDSAGKVPASQLPSYVDDVLEYDKQSSFPATGEAGKIYVAKDTNKTYRWSGTAYVEISPSLALGETSSTAYRGDRGKVAYDHASAKGSAFAAGLYKITTNSEGHVTAATAVAKSDITGLGIPGSDTNTHRPIQVNGTEVLGNNTTALNLKAGSNVSVTNSSGTVTIAATDTTYSSKAAASGGTDVSLVTTGEKAVWNAKTSNTGTVTSVAASGSGGITISGSPVTTSGTINIGLNLNTAINGLSTGDSVPADNDYVITQYVNGGTTTTTYHRRPISKIWDYIKSKITKTVVTDALGYTPPTTDTNTHRPIQVNGTEVLGNNTTALNLKAGSNVSVTNSSGTVTITATDTTYSAATQSAAGLMSATDKTKLDGIATGATANVGTITGIKMNGASKGTSGVVDLGTVITAHQNISGKADKVTNATSGNFAALDSSGNLTDSGKTIVTSVSSSDNTNAPTSKAVATYVSENSVNAYVSGTVLVLY